MQVVTTPATAQPFQAFYVARRAAVLRLLVGMVGPDAAQDCFQETFLKALRAWPPPEQGARLDAWVLTIAHRTAIDELRRRRREIVVEAVPEQLVDDRSDQVLARLDAADLWAAVAVLPPKQRAAVVLRSVLDLSHAQVARVLGGSEQSARRAFADGIGALRAHATDGTLEVER